MSEDIILTEELSKIIDDSGVSGRMIPFGHGVLAPIFSTGPDITALIIAYNHGQESEVGERISADSIYESVKEKKIAPIVGLSFPTSQDGLTGINALRHWLDKIESIIEDELA